MQGFVDAFEQSDYSIMFTQVRSSGHLAAEDPVGAALPFRPAGIVLGTPINCDRTRAALLSHRTPVVEMWNQTVRRLDMVVEVADHEAGRQLGQHLHAQGYRRIVFCGEAAGPLEVRLAGLKEALSDVGLGLAGEVFADRFAALGEAKGALDAVFANVPDCDAVVMGSDMLSAGALIRAVELGILVPQQLGISGIGGLDRAGLPSHGVTTLAADGYAVGRDAAQMLLRRLEVGDGGEQVRSHEVRLEIGKSTSRI